MKALLPILLILTLAGCKKSESPTSTTTPIQTITIASGFTGRDTLVLGGNVYSAENGVGPYNLTQFDSVRIKFTVSAVGNSQPLSFYVYFGVTYLLGDTLSYSRSYARTMHSYEIVHADSVAIMWTDFTYNYVKMKLYDFSLIGWRK